MEFFKGYIGQSNVIEHLSSVCNAVAEERSIPFQPLAFTGHAGLGKTYLAELFSEELHRASGGNFRLVTINSQITPVQLVEKWVDNIEGKKVLIFMDEAHAIKKNTGNLLKVLLETGKKVKEVRYNDSILTSNPYEHLWVAATNEEPKDSALFGTSGRFESLMFRPYKDSEVKDLISQKVNRWKGKLAATPDAIAYLAGRVIPNARAISQLIEGDCLLHGGNITVQVAKELCSKKGYFPKGLRREDITSLQFVGKDEKGRQVNEIAAACGGEDPRTTSYRLQYLAGYGFIATQSGKKVLTAAGKQYLTDLAALQSKKKKAPTNQVEPEVPAAAVEA